MSNPLANNFIVKTYRRIGRLLTASERRKAVYLAVLTVIGACVDVLGLAAMVPVMMAATDPPFIQHNPTMRGLAEALGYNPELQQDRGMFLVFLALMLLLIFIVKNAVAVYLYWAQSRYAFRVGTELARRQFIKYYNWGYTYFQNTNSADIINQVMNIPTFFTSAILLSAINLFCEALVMILIIVGIAISDITLFAALIVILVPSGFLIYNGTKNRLYKLGQEQASLYTNTFSKLNQSIFGYVDVRLNNKEKVFLEAFTQNQDQLNRNQQLRYLIGLIPTRSLEVIAVAGIAITFVYTFLFVKDPEQLYGFIAIFAAAAFRILPSMNRLLVALMGMKSHQYALDSLEEGGLPFELDKVKVEHIPFHERIEFRNVSFTYEGADHPAVHNLTFTVKKGERIGIVGESGSGKTTLMNLLLRFLEEQQGGIFVDGRKLKYEDKASWRAIMGYVKQDVYLMDATLKENIAFGESLDEIDEARVWDAIEKASLTRFVESLPNGLLTQVGEMGSKLSGGQKQRIGIARALYANSQVLVFDEATSALDTETEHSITDSIEHLKGGQTIFVIAHRITTLRFCDRILELKDGDLIGIHSYEELIRKVGLSVHEA